MTIRIIKEPEIVLTQAEHDRLLRQWECEQQYTSALQSFEAWLRNRGHGSYGRAEQGDALGAAEDFLALLVRGFDKGHVKAKPVIVMDPNASSMDMVSMADKARECLEAVQKARQA